MRSVVVCGSTKFQTEIDAFVATLKESGITVFAPDLVPEWDNLNENTQRLVALGLTHEHFYKIRMADVVFIYNKDGYVGNSTTLEIGCAVALGKPVYALHEDEEPCRQVLFRSIVPTPEELIKILQ